MPMPDLGGLRDAIKKKANIGDRQLRHLITQKVNETYLPRDVATMALAQERGVSISRYASNDDLAQLRNAAQTAPAASSAPAQPNPAPPRKAASRSTAAPKPQRPRSRKKVFVVHGRNEPLRKDLFAFLRSIGLQPLEWQKGIEATQKGSPSINEILDAMFQQAAAVVVLLTPDDMVRLKPEFQSRNDPAEEKKYVGQARPNVLFEAGMAFASHHDSVVLVQVGWVKPFTDVGGLHITRMNNTPEKRQELASKLKTAGCDVDTGGSDWYSTGNFDITDREDAK